MSDQDQPGKSFFDLPPAQESTEDASGGLADLDPTATERMDSVEQEAFTGDGDRDKFIGRVLDNRFRLQSLLGQGGMGRVYKGVQLSVERDVAVKLLHSQAMSDPVVQKRFMREARVISGFSHPNIVRLIDFGHSPELHVPYLVMEFVDGVNLGDLMRKGRLRPDFALEVISQVCNALMEAHRAGIVHRDLKPDNLHCISIAGGSLQVKVLDFGIAFPKNENSNLTSTGMICGTSYYMAPEQARARDIDARTDIYSLGVILFEMLTGVLPFQGDSDFQVLLRHVQEEAPLLRDYADPDQVPEEIGALVQRLLSKDPGERPQSARELRDHVDELRKKFGWDPVNLDEDRSLDEAFDAFVLEADAQHTPFLSDKPAPSQDAPSQHPDDVVTQPGETQPGRHDSATQPAASMNLSLLAVGLLITIAILGVGAAGVYVITQTPFAKTSDAVKAPATPAPPTEETIPLGEFAGRCSVIGESEAKYDSVYFYPDIGEILFDGASKLHWSTLEIASHEGKNVTFSYSAAGDDNRVESSVEHRDDKRVFDFSGDQGGRFVCRSEEFSDYYSALGVPGTYFRQQEEALEIAATAQRLEFFGAGNGTDTEESETKQDDDQKEQDSGENAGPGTFTYRILAGSAAGNGAQIAARPRDDRKTNWMRWEIRLDTDDGELTVTRGDETAVYSSEPIEETSSKKGSRPAAASPSRKPSTGAPSVSSGESASSGDEDKGRYIPPRSSKKWDQRLRSVMGKCNTAATGMKNFESNLDRVISEYEGDELERRRAEVIAEQNKNGQLMREAGQEFSQLVQDMNSAGFKASKVMQVSEQWQECVNKL